MNLVKELKKRNIKAREYRRPPAGLDVFAITIDRRKKEGAEGTVLVNQGTARVEVVGSVRHRQVAATIRERSRVVRRTVRISQYADEEPTLKGLEKQFRNNFPMTMPFGTQWTEDKFRTKKFERYNGGSPYYHCWARVTATVPNRTVNHLLIGMDETANFISPLPKKVKSIRSAHSVLRPKGVPANAQRQGEWFFVKTGRRMTKHLSRLARQAKRITLGNTTHVALTAINIGGRQEGTYAHGYIWDSRSGHHAPLYLKGWHKCVHNAEAKLHVSSDQREAAQRRRNRAWD